MPIYLYFKINYFDRYYVSQVSSYKNHSTVNLDLQCGHNFEKLLIKNINFIKARGTENFYWARKHKVQFYRDFMNCI
jgi:hypothetical protein